MAHELIPRTGRPIAPATVAAKLRQEFAFVTVDPAAGRRRALALATRFEAMGQRNLGPSAVDGQKQAARLRGLTAEDALVVRFGDDEQRTLEAFVLAGENLRFGYADAAEEAAARSLLDRCARVLEADVVLV